MAEKYKLGSKNAAIKRMAEYAIRDQQTLVDALLPPYEREPDEGTAIAIKHAKDCITDFKRIAKGSNADS